MKRILIGVGAALSVCVAVAEPTVESTSSLTISYDLRTDTVRKVTDAADILALARDWAGDGNVVTVAAATGADTADPSTWMVGTPAALAGTTWTPTETRLYKLELTAADGAKYAAYFDLTELSGATPKNPLDGFEIKLPSTVFPVTGEAIEPDVTVSDGSTTLVRGADYTVLYANNIDEGTATVAVLGTGDYVGGLMAEFTIVPASAEEQTSAAVDDIPVDLRRSIVRKIVKLEELFPFAWNSSATWAKDGDAGVTAALRVVLASGEDKEDPTTWVDGGVESLEAGAGEGTTVWVPTQASLARAELTVGADVVYGFFDLTECSDLEKAKSIADFEASLADIDFSCDGYAKTPKVTLVDGDGNVLVEGVDYSVTYSKNLNVGTATVTIAGIGEYEGVITKTFNIVPMQPQPRGESESLRGSIDTTVADEVALPVATWRELPVLVFNDTKYWDRDGDTNELNMVRVTLDRLDAEGVPTGEKVTVLDEANGEGETNTWKRLKAGGYLAVSAIYKKNKATDKNWTLAGTNAVRRIDINGQPGLMLLVK